MPTLMTHATASMHFLFSSRLPLPLPFPFPLPLPLPLAAACGSPMPLPLPAIATCKVKRARTTHALRMFPSRQSRDDATRTPRRRARREGATHARSRETERPDTRGNTACAQPQATERDAGEQVRSLEMLEQGYLKYSGRSRMLGGEDTLSTWVQAVGRQPLRPHHIRTIHTTMLRRRLRRVCNVALPVRSGWRLQYVHVTRESTRATRRDAAQDYTAAPSPQREGQPYQPSLSPQSSSQTAVR